MIPGFGKPNAAVDYEAYLKWCDENNVEPEYDQHGNETESK